MSEKELEANFEGALNTTKLTFTKYMKHIKKVLDGKSPDMVVIEAEAV